MSYDLMVFEPSAAPRDPEQFMAWYQQQTEWEEDHEYDDPAISSPALQGWFEEIRTTFPPMNGPLAPPDEEIDAMDAEEEANLTDYSIGRDVIYGAFAWSVSDKALETVRRLAEKYHVGFYNPSDEDGPYFY